MANYRRINLDKISLTYDVWSCEVRSRPPPRTSSLTRVWSLSAVAASLNARAAVVGAPPACDGPRPRGPRHPPPSSLLAGLGGHPTPWPPPPPPVARTISLTRSHWPSCRFYTRIDYNNITSFVYIWSWNPNLLHLIHGTLITTLSLLNRRPPFPLTIFLLHDYKFYIFLNCVRTYIPCSYVIFQIKSWIFINKRKKKKIQYPYRISGKVCGVHWHSCSKVL